MKNLVLTLFTILLCYSNGWTQCPQNITFNTQEEINNFAVLYPNCTVISGDLSIVAPLPAEDDVITNLTPLSQIAYVGGDVLISGNDSLNTLTGLENISLIGGTLQVQANAISDMTGLNGLNVIGNRLLMADNNLVNLTGLENLIYIGGSLTIVDHFEMTSLSGLDNLLIIGFDFILQDVQLLNDLTALSNITFLGGKLALDFLPALTDLAGLQNIINIGGDLNIGGTGLTSVSALEHLTAIGGQLIILDNDDLFELTGLENIAPNTILYVEITENDNLSVCSLENICTYLLQGLPATIENNGPGCLSPLGLCSPCPVEDVVLRTQQEVDNFPLFYSGCDILNVSLTIGEFSPLNDITDLTPLSQLVGIAGDLTISGNHALNALVGLDNIESIGGTLEIANNDALTDLTGLGKLDLLGGDLLLADNLGLTTLTGLETLNFISGSMTIVNNASLTALSGLEGLLILGNSLIIHDNAPLNDLTALSSITFLGGQLEIFNQPALTNLTGLQNISSIGGSLFINSTGITSLSALENLTNIGGSLILYFNDSLTELTGLENVDLNNIVILELQKNANLSVCNLENICTYLSEGLPAIIKNNAPTCSSPDIGCSPCPTGDITLRTQQEVDEFMVLYPDCEELPGSLTIRETASDLTPLSQLTYIGGNLTLIDNPSLQTVSGLEGITEIGGTLEILSTGANELLGLSGLNSVGGSISLSDNDNLTGLIGLENLTAINGGLYITDHNNLVELVSLNNIDPYTISDIGISDNPNLSICNVESICTYLALGLPAEIAMNAPDCTLPDIGCSPCPAGDIVFDTQVEVDEFILLYPDCTELPGNVFIRGSVVDVISLSHITYIGGDLTVMDENNNLGSLLGLENVTEIGGSLAILSTAVNELLGLNGLQSIGGSLSISDNDNLTSFIGLENLTAIGGGLYISDHTGLIELTGLNNINPNTITYLELTDNSDLSVCNLENICIYLSLGLPANIGTNAPGCNLPELCSAPSYCEAQGKNTTYEYIQSIDIDGFTNESGNDGGYGDYTDLPAITIGGANVPITLTPGFSENAYDENWKIWIDLNKDGDFEDAGEEVFSGTSYGVESLTAMIHVPASFGLTRMRVVMRWNKTPDPCGEFKYGEVEDYLVDLGPRPENKIAVENDLVQTYPNPASSFVNVDMHDIIFNSNVQSVTAVIYTMSGQQVHSQEMEPTTTLTINTQRLPEASYILRLGTDDGRTFTGKFVKL